MTEEERFFNIYTNEIKMYIENIDNGIFSAIVGEWNDSKIISKLSEVAVFSAEYAKEAFFGNDTYLFNSIHDMSKEKIDESIIGGVCLMSNYWEDKYSEQAAKTTEYGARLEKSDKRLKELEELLSINQ